MLIILYFRLKSLKDKPKPATAFSIPIEQSLIKLNKNLGFNKAGKKFKMLGLPLNTLIRNHSPFLNRELLATPGKKKRHRLAPLDH